LVPRDAPVEETRRHWVHLNQDFVNVRPAEGHSLTEAMMQRIAERDERVWSDKTRYRGRSMCREESRDFGKRRGSAPLTP
jgi:hypothetical protein